ncbi:MAG TPA: TetR/AcrR family transcriptional regulator [Myxococcota bacterium]
MRRRAQVREFAPNKSPSQQRSRATFDALVDACTWLLPRRGFVGTTTNHIAARAGVSVASLYEYFPGKDAVVAQVAERLVERVLARLGAEAERAARGGAEGAVRIWIDAIYETVARERELVAVFEQQVPYTRELPAAEQLGARLLAFSERIRASSAGFVHPELSRAGLHLLVNLVTSTVLQAVLTPPSDVSRRELLDELARRVEDMIRHAPP